jgi:S-disulfanyl-L-cysteine oxidoreductase SoxD
MKQLIIVLGAVFTISLMAAAQAPPKPVDSARSKRFGIGTPATPEQITALDIDVRPDGTGLPAGSGTASDGATLYAQKCAACHGANGEGGTADVLVGAEPKNSAPFGPEYERWKDARPDVPFTIGNYWPYATTLFDYVRRAMPATAPGSLTADETYAVVAWLLAKNEIIAESEVMNRETLPRVRMPARSRFVPDNRRGGAEVK